MFKVTVDIQPILASLFKRI